MTFDEIHQSVRWAYAAHQRLMRLGIDAEHLFTGAFPINNVGVNIVRVVVRRDGKTNLFVIDVCKTELTNEQYTTKWSELVTAMQVDQAVSRETRERMYDDWPVNNVALMLALKAKGLLPVRR